MKAHSSSPDAEDLERMGEIGSDIVKQHISQPSSHDDSEEDEEEEIIEL